MMHGKIFSENTKRWKSKSLYNVKKQYGGCLKEREST
jgi:hypothetical protein